MLKIFTAFDPELLERKINDFFSELKNHEILEHRLSTCQVAGEVMQTRYTIAVRYRSTERPEPPKLPPLEE